MNEKDPTNLPENGVEANEAGTQNAATEPQQAMPSEQPATAAGEPTQAMPATEPAQTQAVPPVAQPTQTQPIPPTGQPVPTQPMPPQGAPYSGAPAPVSQPSPTGALVCGILAIVFCFIPIVGIVLGIVAIVLAGKYFKAGGTQGQGKAGRICGIVGLVLSIIMIIVNCIVVFTALTALDKADVDVYDLYATSQSSSAASSSASTSGTPAGALDTELYAVVDPELDKIKSADPAMVASIAAIVEESLNSELASENITLADLKVDPTELTKAMIQGFDYEYDFTDIDGNEGEAWYTVTCKDTYSIATEFEAQISTLLTGDTSQYTTMEAAYEAIGKALMDAVNSTTPSDDSMVDYDLTKTGDKWVLDPESWTDELDYLFGF